MEKRIAFEMHYPGDHVRGMVDYMSINVNKVSAVNCEIIDKVLEIEWEQHKQKVQAIIPTEPHQTEEISQIDSNQYF